MLSPQSACISNVSKAVEIHSARALPCRYMNGYIYDLCVSMSMFIFTDTHAYILSLSLCLSPSPSLSRSCISASGTRAYVRARGVKGEVAGVFLED